MTADARVVAPGVTIAGNATTGTGDSNGRPIPTEERETADLFDRLEAGRQRRAIRSPIVLRGPSPAPTAKASAERKADAQRFAAPDIRVDIPMDRTAPETVTPQVSPVVPADTTKATESVAPTRNPCPVERCGDVLTGGGAPRGWILIRVVGGGPPRRFHSVACVVLALTVIPARLDRFTQAEPTPPRPHVHGPAAPPAPPEWENGPPRRTRRAWTETETAEALRRYQAGETPPQIGEALDRTAKTVRDEVDRAGIERRDDRALHSGGRNQIKAYPDDLVARVRRLYTLHELTQDEVAHAIGTSVKVVQNIMARHGIQARPAAPRPKPRPAPAERAPSRPLERTNSDLAWRALLAALGKDATDVRAWCHTNGVTLPAMGPIPRAAREAFTTAHTHPQEETA